MNLIFRWMNGMFILVPYFQVMTQIMNLLNLFKRCWLRRSFDGIEHHILNSNITHDEKLRSTESLKLNKASGCNLVPQHLVYGVKFSLPYIRKLFNKHFAKGEFPSSWAKSITIHIHKKGSCNNPNNFRGIALLDVLSKFYITIITKRVTFYVEAYNKLCQSQGEFGDGYTTVDNAFVLYSAVVKYLSIKSRSIYVIMYRSLTSKSIWFRKLFFIVRCDGQKWH